MLFISGSIRFKQIIKRMAFQPVTFLPLEIKQNVIDRNPTHVNHSSSAPLPN